MHSHICLFSMLKTCFRVLFYISFCLLIGCSTGNDNGPVGNDKNAVVIDDSGEELVGDWVLTWRDEFNSPSLDLSKWEYMVGDGSNYGIPGWGNDELQHYLPDNIEVNSGELVISAVGGVGEHPFTSGRLRSIQDTASFTYGRIEAKIKLPSAAGLWSAFWMLANDNSPYGSWPSAGEIDIMEFIDSDGPFYTFGTLHFGARNDEKGQIPSSDQHIPYIAQNNYKFKALPENIEPLSSACLEASNDTCTKIDPTVNPNGIDCLLYGIKNINQDGNVEYIGQDGAPLDGDDEENPSCEIELPRCKSPVDGFCETEDPTEGFHVYAIEWDQQEIRWFVDGTHYQTVPASSYWTYGRPTNSPLTPYTSGSESAPFDTPFHLLLNVAVGGKLPAADPATNVSGEMRVDWVRVYECEKNPQTGLGCEGGLLKDQSGDPIDDSPLNINNPYRNFEHYTNLQLPRIRIYELFNDGFQSLFSGGSQRNIGYSTSQVLDSNSVLDDGETLNIALSSGTYIDIIDAKEESIEVFTLSGMGSSSSNGNAELIFDMKVNSSNQVAGSLEISMVSINENTPPDESQSEVFTLNLNGFSPGVWQRSLSIPLNNLLNGSNVDVEKIRSLLRIESEDNIEFELDNIRLVCGSATDCRIQSVAAIEEQIFGSAPYTNDSLQSFGQPRFSVDGKNDVLWDKPFTAWDNQVGKDYIEPRSNHVTWSLKDIDSNPEDEINDYVIQVNFGDSGASGVFYLGASSPIDVSGYSQGSLVMDIRVLEKPPGVDINYKVDHCYYGNDDNLYCNQGKGTGEMPLPLDPLSLDFQTIRIPFCTLISRGLDDVMVVSPMVIVPGPGGSANNVTLQIDNVYFDHQPVVADCSTNPPVDFENTEKIYPVGGFAGGVPTLVENPFLDILNPTANVLKIVKGAPEVSSELYGGGYLDFTDPLDFALGSTLSMKVLAKKEDLKLGVKLEYYNGSSYTSAFSKTYNVLEDDMNQWILVDFDFTGKVTNANDWTRLSFIINDGVAGTGDLSSTFYIDDIEQINTGDTAFDWDNDATLIDFDIPNTIYVINGWGGASGVVVTDPLDPNNSVGKHTRSFVDIKTLTAGPFLGPFPTQAIPVNSSVMYACMDVLSPSDTTYNITDEDGDWIPPFFRQRDSASDVTMKLEDALVEYQVVSSTAVVQNTYEWQTLFFDFSTGLGASFPDQPTYVSANGDGSYEKIVLNFEGENITDLTYYFDNIEFVEDNNTDGVIDVNDCASLILPGEAQ